MKLLVGVAGLRGHGDPRLRLAGRRRPGPHASPFRVVDDRAAWKSWNPTCSSCTGGLCIRPARWRLLPLAAAGRARGCFSLQFLLKGACGAGPPAPISLLLGRSFSCADVRFNQGLPRQESRTAIAPAIIAAGPPPFGCVHGVGRPQLLAATLSRAEQVYESLDFRMEWNAGVKNAHGEAQPHLQDVRVGIAIVHFPTGGLAGGGERATGGAKRPCACCSPWHGSSGRAN